MYIKVSMLVLRASSVLLCKDFSCLSLAVTCRKHSVKEEHRIRTLFDQPLEGGLKGVNVLFMHCTVLRVCGLSRESIITDDGKDYRRYMVALK